MEVDRLGRMSNTISSDMDPRCRATLRENVRMRPNILTSRPKTSPSSAIQKNQEQGLMKGDVAPTFEAAESVLGPGCTDSVPRG